MAMKPVARSCISVPRSSTRRLSQLWQARAGMATIKAATLLGLAAKQERFESGKAWSVAASYNNLASRHWQRIRGRDLLDNPGAPPVLRTWLPRRMVTSRLASDAIEVTNAQAP